MNLKKYWIPTIKLGTLLTAATTALTGACHKIPEKQYKPWTFAYVADIQVGSPRSFRFAPSWNENWETAKKQIIETNPEFLLIGGDLSRDGSIHKWELESIKNDLDRLPFPYHVIAGNMDTGNKHTKIDGARKDRKDTDLNVTSAQLQQFESVFGPLWWSFVHKNLRVSGFCDMLLGSNLPLEKELWQWLEDQKQQSQTEHHIWLMHYALFADSLNEPAWDITNLDHYLEWYFTIDHSSKDKMMDIFLATHTNRVITGHIHCRKDFTAQGIAFDLAPATCFSQWDERWPDGDPTLGFYKYDVYPDKIEKTFIPLEKLSTAKGYGPGGHPLPEQRDYSIAWEKDE